MSGTDAEEDVVRLAGQVVELMEHLDFGIVPKGSGKRLGDDLVATINALQTK